MSKKGWIENKKYLESLKLKHLDPKGFRVSYDVSHVDESGGLEDQLAETDEAIAGERERLSGPVGNPKLNLKISMGAFGNFEGAINIALIYGVFFFFYFLPVYYY